MSSCCSLRGENHRHDGSYWPAKRVVRQLGRPDCVVRRCWDQLIREMSFTRRPVSGRSRQTNHLEDHRIVRNACVQPTTSSATIQAQVLH
ncbi:HTH_Tnp_Tc3_2 domain-containing protein [Trichonephila clavipes]|nr:HTH_Tnp_Tc3_2 domain-containing protein [Trichonephila clavipes]